MYSRIRFRYVCIPVFFFEKVITSWQTKIRWMSYKKLCKNIKKKKNIFLQEQNFLYKFFSILENVFRGNKTETNTITHVFQSYQLCYCIYPIFHQFLNGYDNPSKIQNFFFLFSTKEFMEMPYTYAKINRCYSEVKAWSI